MMDTYRIGWKYTVDSQVPFTIEMSFSRGEHSLDESTRVMRAWKDGLIAAGFHDVTLSRVTEEMQAL